MSALSDALNAANVNGWSAREIARRAEGKVSHSVVADYLNGREAKVPRDYVLAAFVEVFPRLSLRKLRELSGLPAGEEEPYEPPEEAHRLDSRQRRAVDEVIRLLAQTNTKAGDGDERDAAPMNDEPTVAGVLEARRRRAENLRQPVRKAAREDPRKKS